MKKPVQKTPGPIGTRFDSVKNSLKSRVVQVLPAKESIKDRLPKWPVHVWIFLAVLLVTLIIGGIYLLLSPSLRQRLVKTIGLKPTPEEKATPRPSPLPLASGKQTYMVSGSTQGAPKITEAMVDPIDPAQGSSQKWTLKAIEVGNGPIGEVTVTIYTDNDRKILSLNKTGTSETEETWEGSWTVSDSYDYKYVAILKAKNEAGKIHKVDLVLR